MTGKLSEKNLKQKRMASRTHGTYALRDRGADAMTPIQRSRRAELVEQLETKDGVIEAMRDQAIDTLLLANVAQSYVIKQHQEGKSLDDIDLLRSLPRFWNAANRALKTFYDVLPDSEGVIDAAVVLEDLQREQSE